MYMNCIDLLWFHDVITEIKMAKGCKGYRDWKCTDCLYPECFLYNMLSPRLSIWEIGFILIVGLEYWLNRHAACIIHRDFYLGTLDANTQFGLFNTARAAWTFCSFCMETSSWYSFAMGQDVSIQAWKMKSCRCEVMDEEKQWKMVSKCTDTTNYQWYRMVFQYEIYRFYRFVKCHFWSTNMLNWHNMSMCRHPFCK